MVVRPLVPSEEDLIAGIRSGDDHVLKLLYLRCFSAVLRMVTMNSGTEEEADDVFQEAIVVLYRNVGGGMELRCQVKTYVYSVARRLWLKELNRRKQSARFDDAEEFVAVEDEQVQRAEEAERHYAVMRTSLEELGEPCAELLKQFYITGRGMTDIAESFGYTNADNAKNQKYKCLQRLKKIFFERMNNTK
jgi:RNA polymerase sigma factor (sigma-70 family)